MGTYNTPYCSMSVVFTVVYDCLPSGHPILQVQSIKGELFVDQVKGDIYKYDHDNKLFISLGKVDHSRTKDFRSFVIDQDQKWLNVVAPYWQ